MEPDKTDAFGQMIERVLSHEGDFTDNRADPGNWTGGRIGEGELRGTKFGIAARGYPTVDIKRLTRLGAIELYRRDFWDRIDGDRLPPALAFQVLDAAVNHGIGNAVRWLQRAVDVADDGAIGPVTHAAIQRQPLAVTLLRFNAIRLDFYTKLSTFGTFGKGWSRRLAENLEHAARDL